NHHILYDGWSTGIILGEFFNAYNALVNKKDLAKPAKNKNRFKEFVKWLKSQDKEKEKTFWQAYLQGLPTGVQLPLKRTNRKKDETWNKGSQHGDYRCRFDFPLKLAGGNKGVTAASLLYTAWGILLQKYSGEKDVIFGTTVSGRSAKVEGIENMVGLFINTLPLRVSTRDKANVLAVLTDVNEALQQREIYEGTSLVEIKENSQWDRGSREELFDSIVVIENYPLHQRLIDQAGSGKLSVKNVQMKETTHYDLALGVTMADGLMLNFSYNKEQLEDDIIIHLANHFQSVLKAILQNPGAKVSEIEIIPVEEKRQALFDFNSTGTDYPKDKTIHELFLEQAGKNPNNTALIGMAHGGPGGAPIKPGGAPIKGRRAMD
ncbi:MAG: hypothetical protein GY940_10485, partial [bacterium]|nr:hypothetical protein [bacterium]